MQLDHYSSKFTPKTFPITLVCDNVTKAANIGSLFRISDAFGVEKLFFCGNTIPLGRRFTKTSRATEKTMPYEIAKNSNEVILALKEKGYLIISLEITENSTPIHQLTIPKNTPIAVIIGDENFGISNNILSISNITTHITMFGKNSSMNVVQAANIALYEITKQLT